VHGGRQQRQAFLGQETELVEQVVCLNGLCRRLPGRRLAGSGQAGPDAVDGLPGRLASQQQ
jgi:hypothetical protein